jgi:hypothetical protein
LWHDAKGRIAETEEAAIAMHQLSKHAPTTTDTHATVEGLLEVVFSMQSMLRIYNEDQWDQLVCELHDSQSNETAKYGHEPYGTRNQE